MSRRSRRAPAQRRRLKLRSPGWQAGAGALGLIAAVLIVHTGLTVMGDYATGADAIIPLPRTRDAMAPALAILTAGVGVALYSASALGEALVAALLPERPSATRVWSSLSPGMRALLVAAAVSGSPTVALDEDGLVAEFKQLRRRQRHQRHLRLVGPTAEALAQMSPRLSAIARHPSAQSVISYDNKVV